MDEIEKSKLEAKLLGQFLEHTFPDITKEVNEFLKNTPWDKIPFGNLKRFEISQIPKSFYVVPEGLEEEDLNEIKNDYNRLLSKIGLKYGIELRLPYWAYEK